MTRLPTAAVGIPPRREPSRRKPPAGLPGPAALAPLARRLLQDAVRVARWAGELAAVDKRGDLLPQDAQDAGHALALTVDQALAAWERARLVGLVELRGAGAGPGWRLHAWEHDDEAVIRGWAALFDAWTLLVSVPDRSLTALAGHAVDHAPQLLSFLHLVDGPVAQTELGELLRRGLDDQWHGGADALAGAPRCRTRPGPSPPSAATPGPPPPSRRPTGPRTSPPCSAGCWTGSRPSGPSSAGTPSTWN
ncbi:hypothetical protein ACFQZC_10630 [Streptacidiphilus monticola]